MTSHTPGPWTNWPRTAECMANLCDKGDDVVGGLMDHAKQLEKELREAKETIGGGHCIRDGEQSPCERLLEALKSAYQDLHEADPKCVRLFWYRAAIAKAEGK